MFLTWVQIKKGEQDTFSIGITIQKESLGVRLFKTRLDNVIAVGVIERRALLRQRRSWAA